MHFEEGYIYHIYNQGNNRQKIFFERKNYLYFLQKIRTYILPYGDILAWALMPNHFHLLVKVNETKLLLNSKGEVVTNGFALSEALGKSDGRETFNSRTLNFSIGLLLRSYTNAINKQENRSGSLFRKKTKAECVTCPEEQLAPSFIMRNGVTEIQWQDYLEICFHYIHNNPVKANLATTPEAWEFSSARDYAGIRSGNLINKSLAKQLKII